MTLRIMNAGPQATLQGNQRAGYRYSGIPSSGPADPVSHAIANHLVGNHASTTGIEITYGPFSVEFQASAAIALTGAVAPTSLNGRVVSFHETLFVKQGDFLEVGRPDHGLRTYLAISGGVVGDEFLGSESTYIPAGLGGFDGRALRSGDVVETSPRTKPRRETTPETLQFPLGNSFALRASEGPDYTGDCTHLWTEQYKATRRASRIGIELDGAFPKIHSIANLPSAGIFPGALQLPPQGRGFLLLPDCQTTGGYPHILQVNRSDRHLLGQIRPGDSILFLHRTREQAADDLIKKQKLIASWIGGFRV
ncbi:Allophanate hydrolase 2 subunit 2 [hydrothermal vent metagenome]|uniref:Allophanate hydrolase 2 subunit 2 n=1 Tax=hydrothermal vent metagenome TaxID=652676 RepID=A0A160TXI2_9ZZZZ